MSDFPTNQEFIDMYTGGTPVAEIATAMGWNTKNPKQMVQAKVTRLRKAGHAIPYRGLPQQALTVEEAESMIDRTFTTIRQSGLLIIHEDRTGRYKVVER